MADNPRRKGEEPKVHENRGSEEIRSHCCGETEEGKVKGKGIGPAPIIAVAIVSTIITIFLDHLGVTTQVQKLVEKVISHG